MQQFSDLRQSYDGLTCSEIDNATRAVVNKHDIMPFVKASLARRLHDSCALTLTCQGARLGGRQSWQHGLQAADEPVSVRIEQVPITSPDTTPVP